MRQEEELQELMRALAEMSAQEARGWIDRIRSDAEQSGLSESKSPAQLLAAKG